MCTQTVPIVPNRIRNNSQTPNVQKRQLKKHMYITEWHQTQLASCLLSCSTHSFITVMIWLPPLPSRKALFLSWTAPTCSHDTCLPSFLQLFSFVFLSVLRGPAYEARHRVSLFGERQSYWIVKLQNNEAKMKAPHSLFSFACTHLIRRAAEGWGDESRWGERESMKDGERLTDRGDDKRNVWIKILFPLYSQTWHGWNITGYHTEGSMLGSAHIAIRVKTYVCAWGMWACIPITLLTKGTQTHTPTTQWCKHAYFPAQKGHK